MQGSLITVEHQTRWSSRIAFIFAAASAAIGLGNVWRFPYMLGQHGGGAFVLMYLAAVIILGIPLLTAEVVLGRLGRQNPAKSMANVAQLSHRSKLWRVAGGLTIVAGYLILSYYVVIVGWVLDYLIHIVIGDLQHVSVTTSLMKFQNLQNNFSQMFFMTSIVVLAAIGIIFLGVRDGLERAVMYMFPALIILLLILIGYSITTGYFKAAFLYLFKPDLTEITAHTVLLAMGQAFFSLNVAMGITMMFSAYLPDKTPIMSSVLAITIADTGVALLSGMVIFPIVFAHQLQPDAGPSLIFQTLPIAFAQMPLGQVTSFLFFAMLFFAAFTSVLAMFEAPTQWLCETFHFSRHAASWIVGISILVLSTGSILSFSHKDSLHYYGMTFFHGLDSLTASYMLPIGGLLIAIFTGWFLSKPFVASQLNWETNGRWFLLWRFILRYVAPVCIVFILLGTMGIL